MDFSLVLTLWANSEQPWTPDFDMPDYKTIVPALLRVAHGERVDDTAEVYYAQDIEKMIDVPQLLRDSGAFDAPSLELPDIGMVFPLISFSSG
jgi:hypothetical protein